MRAAEYKSKVSFPISGFKVSASKSPKIRIFFAILCHSTCNECGHNRKAAPAQTFYEYFIYFAQPGYLDIIIKRYHQFFFPQQTRKKNITRHFGTILQRGGKCWFVYSIVNCDGKHSHPDRVSGGGGGGGELQRRSRHVCVSWGTFWRLHRQLRLLWER